MGWRIADWLGLVFVVAVIYLILRPSSKAAEAVEGFTDMIVSMVRAATSGLTT
jgi:hypothetical protein